MRGGAGQVLRRPVNGRGGEVTRAVSAPPSQSVSNLCSVKVSPGPFRIESFYASLLSKSGFPEVVLKTCCDFFLFFFSRLFGPYVWPSRRLAVRDRGQKGLAFYGLWDILGGKRSSGH